MLWLADKNGMTHKNSPLTLEAKRRFCTAIDNGEAIAHVAKRMQIDRKTIGKWYARWTYGGEAGLEEYSSKPHNAPNKTPDDIEHMVLDIRKVEKWGPRRIAAHLRGLGIPMSAATAHRILERYDMNRLKDLNRPTGDSNRDPNRYEWDHPGDLIHVDIKSVGKIPKGGGWWQHGVGSDEHRASKRVGAHRPGYSYIHNAVDDHTRLAYSEVLEDQKGSTAAEFWLRAVLWFQMNGFTQIHRVITDNGGCYRSQAFAAATDSTGTRRKRTPPYTPRVNGKVEKFNQVLMNEWLYVQPYDSEEDRTAHLADLLNYYNDERPHQSLGDLPPTSRTKGPYYPVAEQPAQLLTPDMDAVFGQTSLFDEHGDPIV